MTRSPEEIHLPGDGIEVVLGDLGVVYVRALEESRRPASEYNAYIRILELGHNRSADLPYLIKNGTVTINAPNEKMRFDKPPLTGEEIDIFISGKFRLDKHVAGVRDIKEAESLFVQRIATSLQRQGYDVRVHDGSNQIFVDLGQNLPGSEAGVFRIYFSDHMEDEGVVLVVERRWFMVDGQGEFSDRLKEYARFLEVVINLANEVMGTDSPASQNSVWRIGLLDPPAEWN